MRRIMMADQPFASFEVCGHCYELRGPFDYTWKEMHYTFVQECRCERDARPRDVRPPTWVSFDFNRGAELCHGCGGAVLRSGSRWSVWFCDACMASAVERNRQAGIAVVPMGRHALMHGVTLSGRSTRSRSAIDAFVVRFGNLFERMQLLEDWSHEVVWRNLVQAGLDRQPTVALPHYLAAVAELDRAERFATMLEWLADHAGRHPPTGHGVNPRAGG
jgi:hypothetical protein